MKTCIATCAGLLLCLAAFAQKEEYRVAAIGFYNLENLFDTLDSPTTNDADFLPGGRLLWNAEKYASKQANMARIISLLAADKTPDGVALLGVAEVENRLVLEDLVAQPAVKDRNYQIVHFDSPDERGIDVGLLYQPKYFTLTGAQALPVLLKDPSTGDQDFTRDVLLVSGLFDGELLHVLVNHWPSRRGGESASAWARAEAAKVCRQVVDSLTALDEKSKIIVMGDLNDDPNNKSVAQVLRAGRSADKLRDGDLYNPMYDLYQNGDGTLAYRDAWNLFDQMIISRGLVWKKAGGWQFHKPVVYRQPWMFQEGGAFQGYPLRTYVGDIFLNGYSDHLPVYLLFLKRK
ncbi:MAG: endonuclease/exonuclease/phosphatase family protein [Saprospirales bacterium]|jgi:predicted extracellular nuclease|nr:endonuclease/exonuclease/phosphatase family protein [Saprospirales bacterium]MBK8923077.1 endonuclease/exonuclease/phosphatase family protein [Saprospirales bacterium]